MNLSKAEIEAEIDVNIHALRINFTWMLELGATITWSIVKEIPYEFELDETAFVEGSIDLCDDRFGLYWDGRERNVRNCSLNCRRAA